MINLEWLRTFRAVYKTKSLSRASEMLNISQPTVSQHIQALESHISKKLFVRKSKGVLETDDGRILNTLVSSSIESLEEAENIISERYSKPDTIITIGISEHLYKSMLCHQVFDLGGFVHVKFGTKQSLITDVEEGNILYAIVPEEINTFDTICYSLFTQNLILVKTKDINLEGIEVLLNENAKKAEQLLTKQKWYAHNTASSYIKLFWLTVFNKKRPTIIPNYIIPNEFEILFQLSNGTGLSVALDTSARFFLEKGLLEKVPIDPIPFRKMSLIANKKKASKETTDRILNLLKYKIYN